jgi:hypothetical protein
METIRTLLIAAALMFATSAMAQTPQIAQPTNTDLHAAYCIQVLQTSILESESILSSFSGPEYNTVPDPNDPPAVRESKAKAAAATRASKADLESQKAMLRRLDLYLKPRIFDPNPMGLVAAKRAAQEDWNRIGSATSSCQNECRPAALNDGNINAYTKCTDECVARAMPDLATFQNKTQSCVNLDWLPY